MKIPAIIIFVIWVLFYLLAIAFSFFNVTASFLLLVLLIITSQFITAFFIYSGIRIILLVAGNNSIRASKRSPVSEI